jgi:hypothetical protein
MKRRYVFAGLALVAALAVAAPAIGGTSLKKLVKKEVAKQLAGKSGPQGPPGAAGAPGAPGSPGAPGTARAYAEIQPRGSAGCPGASPPQPCSFDRDKGISSVTWLGTGTYCVVATGVDAAVVTAVVGVDFSETDNPEGNASAQSNTGCDGGSGFQVQTERIPTSGSDAAVADDNVGFDILIP